MVSRDYIRAQYVTRQEQKKRNSVRRWYIAHVSPELRLAKRGKLTKSEIDAIVREAVDLFPDAQVLWFRNHSLYNPAIFERSKAQVYGGISADPRTRGTYDRIVIGVVRHISQVQALLEMNGPKTLRVGGKIVCIVPDKIILDINAVKAKIYPLHGWKLNLVVIIK